MKVLDLPNVEYWDRYHILVIDRTDNTICLGNITPKEQDATVAQFEERCRHVTVVTSAKHLAVLRISDPTLTAYNYRVSAEHNEILAQLLELHNY